MPRKNMCLKIVSMIKYKIDLFFMDILVQFRFQKRKKLI
jgi:hypothetical protein